MKHPVYSVLPTSSFLYLWW